MLGGKKLIWQLVLSTEIIGQVKLLGAEVKKVKFWKCHLARPTSCEPGSDLLSK